MRSQVSLYSCWYDYHSSADIVDIVVDIVVDKAIDMARDHRQGDPDRPFFQYIAFCATHFPHHVPRRYVDKYLPVFEKGWARTREDRLGRYLDTLEELGELDNTLFLLLSNNGASQEGGSVGSLDSLRFFTGWTTPEDEIAEIREHLDTIGGPRWMNNYAIGWSMASNTPLKRWKQAPTPAVCAHR